ncbi:Ciliary neurotrophic factor receptor alpha [Pteropus alecto]|uniref:Ciliary neurotrophic factor receptor alpha n=1 Tax=Pteropus alecto TaxID=9402 RepID=L5KEY9_PTEAL|nr:Ciliary neurotrophic factor receptor alpha [Pteropus alecto]
MHIHRLSSLYIHLELLGISVTCDFCPVPSPTPTEAPHVQYERLGSDVTLPCGTANWDAAVTWLVNGTDLAPDLLNGSQLVLRGLELGHSGLYACFHRDSWHLRHQVFLHVGCKCCSRLLIRSPTSLKGVVIEAQTLGPDQIPFLLVVGGGLQHPDSCPLILSQPALLTSEPKLLRVQTPGHFAHAFYHPGGL